MENQVFRNRNLSGLIVNSILIVVFSLGIGGCEGDYYITYHFTDLSVEHAENTGEVPVLNELDSIPASAYVLRLYLYPVETSKEGRYLDRETPPSNSSPIDSILVTSNQDFGVDFPAGSSLNDFFLIFNHSYFHTQPLATPFVTNQYSDDYYDQPLPEYADLLLVKPPEFSQDYVFNVFVQLKNGTSWTRSTLPIRIFL